MVNFQAMQAQLRIPALWFWVAQQWRNNGTEVIRRHSPTHWKQFL